MATKTKPIFDYEAGQWIDNDGYPVDPQPDPPADYVKPQAGPLDKAADKAAAPDPNAPAGDLSKDKDDPDRYLTKEQRVSPGPGEIQPTAGASAEDPKLAANEPKDGKTDKPAAAQG